MGIWYESVLDCKITTSLLIDKDNYDIFKEYNFDMLIICIKFVNSMNLSKLICEFYSKFNSLIPILDHGQTYK